MFEKKIYLAITPSTDFLLAVDEWKKHWSHLPVKWVEEGDLHITVIPPWLDVDIDNARKKLLDFKSRHSERINLYFNYVSFGPSRKHARLIWAEGVAPEKLITLKNDLEQVFGLLNVGEPLRLHITLARFKEEDFANFPVQDISQNIDWACSVRDILLLESNSN